MIRTRLIGTGHFVPETVVTNDEIAKRIDTNDEWMGCGGSSLVSC